MKVLTDLDCKRAKAKEKAYKLSDYGGLYLYVTKTGNKIFRLKYRFNKKEKTLTFGHYPTLSLNNARKMRDDAKTDLANHIDPSITKKIKKASIELDNSFETVFKKWFEIKKKKFTSEKHSHDVQSSIIRYVLPHLGKIPLDKITSPMVQNVINNIQTRSNETKSKIKGRISEIFRYGRTLEFTDKDPTVGLEFLIEKTLSTPHPSLTNIDDFKDMLKVCLKSKSNLITKLAYYFMALTALRSGSLRTIGWDDIKDDVLYVPANKMKTRTEFIMPLSKQGIALLEVIKPLTQDAKYIFPSVTGKNKMMSDMVLLTMVKKTKYKGLHTPHGCRASFSTIMNERRPHDFIFIDRALAHKNKGRVEAVYNRSKHIELLRDIMQDWADLICKDMPTPSDLVNSHLSQ